MKKLISILISLVALLSCNKASKEQPDSIYVTTVVDITDSRQVYPDAEHILPLFGFKNNEASEAMFKICTVTDKELNPAIEFRLPNGIETEKDNLEDDPDFRQKLIVKFFTSIRNTIAAFNTKVISDTAINHSECFKSISNELQSLVNQKSVKRVLLVYSDLQENSAFFNCYSKSNQKLVQSNPERVADIFDTAGLMPKGLKNITVSFIYNPISREDDIRFMAMLKVYKKLLEVRGAKVTVSASNSINMQP